MKEAKKDNEEFLSHNEEAFDDDEVKKASIEHENEEDSQWIDISSDLSKKLAKSVEPNNKEKKDSDISKGVIETWHEEEMMEDISNLIGEQICDSLSETASAKEDKEAEANKRKKILRFLRPAMIALATILVLGFLLIFTKPGQYIIIKITSKYVASRMNYNDGSEEIPGEEIDEVEEILPDITQMLETEIDLKAEEGLARSEDYAVNILLLGEEALDSGGARGRTDLIMLATLNTKEKSIKLTSLMRDTFVQIPGYKDNKLNAAYQIGGIELLYETIELNFDVQIDGYCLVGFDNFEKIIDELGGIDISLTNTEAIWLNTSNYVTEDNNKNLIAGLNHMNGDQALGYCRIRQVGTGSKEYDDFGRTSRQRTVLNAIFAKYKELSLFDLMLVVNRVLPMITTDITSGELAKYMQIAYDIGLTEIESFRVPVNGTYRSTYVREMSVLVPNLAENVELLHEFIFGMEE